MWSESKRTTRRKLTSSNVRHALAACASSAKRRASTHVHRRPPNERLRPATFERELCPRLRGGYALLFENFAAAAVEHLEREVIEPLAEAVGPVEDDDGIDGGFFA